jgi:hypothetical protein
MKRRISSTWKWFDRKEVTRTETREIEMELNHLKDFRGVEFMCLQFIGGPTGNEGYDLKSLTERGFMDRPPRTDFAICMGSINSWPSCTVVAGEVQDFIREFLSDSKKETK